MSRRQWRSWDAPPGAKPLWETEFDKNSWEEVKLKHNLNIEAIPYNERLSMLLPLYIPTVAAFKDIASTSAFVGFDTESVPHCYKTTDVGLALLPEANTPIPIREGDPYLSNFVRDHKVEAVSFKIKGRYDDVRSRAQARALIPGSRYLHQSLEHLHFGTECFVDIEELEAALANRIEQFRRAAPGKQLVLVGLSLQNDLQRLCLEFPGIIRFFSRWIDLSTLIKAESSIPTTPNTGLGTALKVFGYPHADTGFDRTHQAANDAIRTLAVLYGLLDPQNVESLVLRPYNFVGIEVRPKVNYLRFQPYRAFLHVDGNCLPPSIDSAQRLALAVQEFNPIAVAADCSNVSDIREPRSSSSIHTSRRTYGCVCFEDDQALEYFIYAFNGKKYGEVVLTVVRAQSYQRVHKEIEDGKDVEASSHETLSAEDESSEQSTHVLDIGSSDNRIDISAKEQLSGKKRRSW
ncbi:hypothetical protein NUW58_g5076 [Xylaria curta]|uniref:Uncharacterized protein n=1 Tax=Xylaria curta TaxID=42375 RepID=A0ACC1P5X6_9PEZI|nr:hypothetical protein NUW58_g5076 [Xylaria curta]